MKVVECAGRCRSVVQEYPEWWSGVKARLQVGKFAKEIRVEGFDYAYQTGFLVVLPRNVQREVRLNTHTLPNIAPALFIKTLRQWITASGKLARKS